MGNTPLQLDAEKKPTTCTCGRSYTHCLACGTKNPYVKKKRSAELSFELGQRVWVFSCNQCPVETHTGMECRAPRIETGEGFEYVKGGKQPKPAELPAWGNSLPGSTERFRLLSEWVTEMQAKKGWGPVKVYVEAQKAGWQLEAFEEVDEDIVQACKDLGIWPSGSGGKDVESEVTAGSHSEIVGSNPTSPTPKEPPVPLEDIIKALQENKE